MLAALVVLYALLVVLNILDGVSTWKVVQPNHWHRERNPLARWVFSRLGLLPGLILSEVLWIGGFSVVFFLLVRHPAWNTALLAALGLGVLVFLFVVSGNFRTHRRIRNRESLLAAGSQTKDKDAERA